MGLRLQGWVCIAVLAMTGCGDSDGSTDADTGVDAGKDMDAGQTADAGGDLDAALDAGPLIGECSDVTFANRFGVCVEKVGDSNAVEIHLEGTVQNVTTPAKPCDRWSGIGKGSSFAPIPTSSDADHTLSFTISDGDQDVTVTLLLPWSQTSASIPEGKRLSLDFINNTLLGGFERGFTIHDDGDRLLVALVEEYGPDDVGEPELDIEVGDAECDHTCGTLHSFTADGEAVASGEIVQVGDYILIGGGYSRTDGSCTDTTDVLKFGAFRVPDFVTP